MLKQVGVPVDEILSQRPDIGKRRSRIPVSYVSESSDEASLANLERLLGVKQRQVGFG
jgi:hypothetical protein